MTRSPKGTSTWPSNIDASYFIQNNCETKFSSPFVTLKQWNQQTTRYVRFW
jgi:hypothetical protein